MPVECVGGLVETEKFNVVALRIHASTYCEDVTPFRGDAFEVFNVKYYDPIVRGQDVPVYVIAKVILHCV